MKALFKHCVLLVFIGIQFLCLSPVLEAGKVSYTVGVVPQFDTRKIYKIWRPILDTLSVRTGFSYKLSLSKSIPLFEQQFSAGEFDIAYMNPYHLIVAYQAQGYLPLARDIKKRLFGIIVVRKDSPFQDIRELAGHRIAFPAPNALGAALIPRAEFANRYRINIIPIYVRSHTSVYLNVLLRQTSAGGGVLRTFQSQKPEVRNQLRILYRTPSVAPHPIAVHPRVPEQDRKKILNALLEMGTTTEGRAELKRIPIRQIGRAYLSDYDELRKMGLAKFYIN